MKRILLIDDEEAEGVLVNYLLKDRYKDDFTFHHVGNLDDARAHLLAQRVDVILLDDRLGGGQTALQTLPQLQLYAFNVPVIVISKNADSSHLREISRLKAHKVVDKFDLRKELETGLLESVSRY